MACYEVVKDWFVNIGGRTENLKGTRFDNVKIGFNGKPDEKSLRDAISRTGAVHITMGIIPILDKLERR